MFLFFLTQFPPVNFCPGLLTPPTFVTVSLADSCLAEFELSNEVSAESEDYVAVGHPGNLTFLHFFLFILFLSSLGVPLFYIVSCICLIDSYQFLYLCFSLWHVLIEKYGTCCIGLLIRLIGNWYIFLVLYALN